MKMVEKLHGTELTPKNKSKNFSSKDKAISKIICNYLKHHQMHYTLSVFASECPTIKSDDSLDLATSVWNLLGVSESVKKMLSLQQQNQKSFLECLINTIVEISQKKFENKSSQCDEVAAALHHDLPKLVLNSHTQTDDQMKMTQGVQTGSIICASTQTKSLPLSVDPALHLNEEIEEQQKKSNNDASLESCQLKLQESKKRFDAFTRADDEEFKQEKFQSSNNGIGKQSHRAKYGKRVKEAICFLNSLDSRLLYIDLKYRSLTNVSNEVFILS